MTYIRVPVLVGSVTCMALLRWTATRLRKSRAMRHQGSITSSSASTIHRWKGGNSPGQGLLRCHLTRRLKVDMDESGTFFPRLLIFLGGWLDFDCTTCRRSTSGKWHIVFSLPCYTSEYAQLILRVLFLDDMWRAFLDTRRDCFFRSVLFNKKKVRYVSDSVSI